MHRIFDRLELRLLLVGEHGVPVLDGFNLDFGGIVRNSVVVEVVETKDYLVGTLSLLAEQTGNDWKGERSD